MTAAGLQDFINAEVLPELGLQIGDIVVDAVKYNPLTTIITGNERTYEILLKMLNVELDHQFRVKVLVLEKMNSYYKYSMGVSWA
jgi:hypothetical protein